MRNEFIEETKDYQHRLARKQMTNKQKRIIIKLSSRQQIEINLILSISVSKNGS